MIVTKLEAARRQLQTAIELWVDDRDPVSTHTLAYAAYQVIHDLNAKAKGEPLLLDSPFIRKERRQDFVNIVKTHAVFFKHADDRAKGKRSKRVAPPSSVDFNPDLNSALFSFSIMGLTNLKQDLSAHELAFKSWFALHHPEMLSEAALQLQQNTLGDETVAYFRSLPKKKFFEMSIKAGVAKVTNHE